MRVDALAATNFRNLAPFRIEPHPRFNIFEGPNGQGKTNLLESIYLLSAFRSFRDVTNRQLIQWGEQDTRVFAEVTRHAVKRDIEIAISSKGKKVKLDGTAITRLPAAFVHFNVVLFTPDHLQLTKAGPEPRRRLLDRAIYATWPSYIDELRAYQAALRNRNALLRNHSTDRTVAAPFERLLVDTAVAVIRRRLDYIDALTPHVERAFHDITNGEHTVKLSYRGSPTDTDDAVRTALETRLEATRATDERRGFTSFGPQTHDLTVTLDGRSARTYASQGQHRALVLALKIAELHHLRAVHNLEPVLLLDDVSSELDEARNAQLMHHLTTAAGQVFLTTTDRRWIQLGNDRHVYAVSEGSVSL